MDWKRVTDILPPEGRDLLVWTGQYMIVSSAEYYDDTQRKEYAALAIDSKFVFNEEEKLHYINCSGRFYEFGRNHYFDNPKVYWAELPESPKELE